MIMRRDHLKISGRGKKKFSFESDHAFSLRLCALLFNPGKLQGGFRARTVVVEARLAGRSRVFEEDSIARPTRVAFVMKGRIE